MRVTVDLEEENDSLTVGELRRRYEDRKVKEVAKVSEVIGKYKGKYLKVTSRFGSSQILHLYFIKELRQDGHFDNYSPAFFADVEKIQLDTVPSVKQTSEIFSEKSLKEAEEITKEQFEKAKSIIDNYLKEVEEYEKTI